jgi:hypothetical protein
MEEKQRCYQWSSLYFFDEIFEIFEIFLMKNISRASLVEVVEINTKWKI